VINNREKNSIAKEIYEDLIVKSKEEIIDICSSQMYVIYKKEKEIKRLKDRIDRANNFIDQEIMYLVKPKDYNKVEMLQDILNDNDFAKGSDKE
jgi:hypothetical protein